MVSPTVYLSYLTEGRDHGVAVGKVLDALGYLHVEGSHLPQSTISACSILLRVRTHSDEHHILITTDTKAFLSGRKSMGDSRIVDLIMVPGYAVWPEDVPCPISYVNAVTQAYSDWIRDLERALVGERLYG